MTFFEKELHRLFDDSERISADAVFAGKTMIAPIGDNLRAKVQFVNTSVSAQYDALRLKNVIRVSLHAPMTEEKRERLSTQAKEWQEKNGV